MTVHLPVLQPQTEQVQEGAVKKHVSYSELAVWMDCAFKHKLKYITKIDLDGPSVHTEFGHVIHDICEEYLKTKTLPSSFDEKREELTNLFTKFNLKGNPKEFQDVLEPIALEVPGFLDENFKDWEYIGAEEKLYESVGVQNDMFFKGFIDGIIRVPKSSRLKRAKPDDYEYHLLDWKSSSWGWDFKKKTDPKKIMQLALYKHFWGTKLGIPLKEIRTGFVLLKRTPLKGKTRCELVSVSIGELTIQKALDTLSKMIGSVKKGFCAKNKNSCKYCVYKSTSFCPT